MVGSRTQRWLRWGTLAVAMVLADVAAEPAQAYPPNFRESTVFSGLTQPTAVAFAPGGDQRVFVAEKSGLLKKFDGLTDTTPDTVLDLRTAVHNSGIGGSSASP